MTVELLKFVRPRLDLSHGLARRMVLGRAADTGINYARAVLAVRLADNGDVEAGVDHLDEEWAKELSYNLDDIRVTVQIEDEERRFPLFLLLEEAAVVDTPVANAVDNGEEELKFREAGAAALERLLGHPSLGLTSGWARTALDAKMAWIRENNTLPVVPGQIKAIYREVFSEAVAEEVYRAVAPRISTFSKQVNLNTVREEVLEALTRPGETLGVYFLIAGRPFETIADVGLRTGVDLKIRLEDDLYEDLTVESAFFNVTSTATDRTGRQETVCAVLKRDEDKVVRVLYSFQKASAGVPVAGRE